MPMKMPIKMPMKILLIAMLLYLALNVTAQPDEQMQTLVRQIDQLHKQFEISRLETQLEQKDLKQQLGAALQGLDEAGHERELLREQLIEAREERELVKEQLNEAGYKQDEANLERNLLREKLERVELQHSKQLQHLQQQLAQEWHVKEQKPLEQESSTTFSDVDLRLEQLEGAVSILEQQMIVTDSKLVQTQSQIVNVDNDVNGLENGLQSLEQEVDAIIADGEASAERFSFLAKLTSDHSGHDVIVFDRVLYNSGSVYDSETGAWTAPIAGVYEFTTNLFVFDSSGCVEMDLYVDSVLITYSRTLNTQVPDAHTVTQTVQLELDAGQNVTVKLVGADYVYGSTSTVLRSYFTGHLVQM